MVLSPAITVQIKGVLKANPQGLSITDIVALVDINRNTAGRYLENLLVSGHVEMRRFGMAKIYTLTQRVPVSAVLSISSNLIMQLDRTLRIIFVNDPFIAFLSAASKDLFGKNIEYSPVFSVFEDIYGEFVDRIKNGIAGTEWTGELVLKERGVTFSCRIAPTVFDTGQKGVSVILEDISERKRAEEMMKESEDRYRTLVEISPDAIIVHQDGTILYANPSALALLNASHTSEIVGRKLFDFIHPGSRDAITANIEKDIRGGKTPPLETYMLRADGTTVTVEGRGVGILFDGKPAVQVAIRDITERKQMGNALQESEEKYRTLVERANDGICIVQDNIIKFCNPAIAAFWGGSAEEILGRNFSDFMHPDALPAVIKRHTMRMASETVPSKYETILQRKDGSRFFAEVNAGICPFEGKPANHVVVRDVNDRKQAAEALRESEEKYHTIFEHVGDAIAIHDLNGNFIEVNDIICRRFGYSREELLKKMVGDVDSPNHARNMVERIRELTEKGHIIFETVHITRDGKQIPTEVNAVLFHLDNKPLVMSVARDITKRKQAEETLKKSEERFRDLINTTADMVWQTDADVRYVYVSPQVERILGYTPDELIGHTPFEFLEPASVKSNRLAFNTAIRTQQHILLQEARWIDRDGNAVVLESHATPIYNGDGTCTGFRGIDRDITDR